MSGGLSCSSGPAWAWLAKVLSGHGNPRLQAAPGKHWLSKEALFPVGAFWFAGPFRPGEEKEDRGDGGGGGAASPHPLALAPSIFPGGHCFQTCCCCCCWRMKMKGRENRRVCPVSRQPGCLRSERREESHTVLLSVESPVLSATSQPRPPKQILCWVSNM